MFVTPAHAKATYTNQIQADQSESTIMAHNIHCEPTLKHHQQHKSININPIHTRCNDDQSHMHLHPAN